MAKAVAAQPQNGLAAWAEKFFAVRERGSTIATEVLAGLTSFMVSAYIIFVNPSILSFSGIPDLAGLGPPFAATLAMTCLTAGLLTILMGVYAKYPFLLAPGMGLNAVVAFQLIVGLGLSWQEAMGVIFLEGVAITILVLTGFRQAVMEAITMRLKRSIAVGIGLFIALIGLVNGGIVVMSGVPSAPVTLGNLATPVFAVTVFGLLVTAGMEARNIKGSLLWGILITTVFAIGINALTGGAAYAHIPGVAVVPSQIVSLPDFSTFGQGFNPGVFFKIGLLSALLAIFSIMLADFFDTMGTVIGIGEQAGFLDQRGQYPARNLRRILLVDSLGAAFGGFASSSSNTTYIESAAGVSEGGRTGLASLVTGLLFLGAMVLAPLAGVIPPQATAPALIIVGFLMFWGNIFDIVKDLPSMKKGDAVVEGLPALLTMFVMPATYSITNGIGVGFISYTVLKLIRGQAGEVHWMLWLASLAFTVYFLFGL